jgi:hypothetical protein
MMVGERLCRYWHGQWLIADGSGIWNIFWDLTASNVITYQTIHQQSLLNRFIHHPTAINII